jgi:inorganic pyrophosphatase
MPMFSIIMYQLAGVRNEADKVLPGRKWNRHQSGFLVGIVGLCMTVTGCWGGSSGNVVSCDRDAEARNAAVRPPGTDEIHLVDDIAPLNADGLVNVVVEIPSGTNAKWEVSKTDGTLHIDKQQGKPRIIEYLPYPANYGMVPQSYLAETQGGDGDPLDVILLGPALPRGCIVAANIIGVLLLIDNGERDDKLIAIYPGSPLGKIVTLEDLENRYHGITTILETWFTNYKGKDKARANGFGTREEALAILSDAVNAYGRSEHPAP